MGRRVDTPVVKVDSETEALRAFPVQVDDTEHFRWWQVAGTGHGPGISIGDLRALYERDMGIPGCSATRPTPYSPMTIEYALRAVSHHLDALGRRRHARAVGTAARTGTDGTPEEAARDEHGNALGGRAPPARRGTDAAATRRANEPGDLYAMFAGVEAFDAATLARLLPEPGRLPGGGRGRCRARGRRRLRARRRRGRDRRHGPRPTSASPRSDAMKLGFLIGAWSGAEFRLPLDRIRLVEDLGYDSIWSSEAYGADALTPLAYLAAVTDRIKLGTAVVQISARSPAATAMAFATIEEMAGRGRVIAGLGLSGPQIVEGWYGDAVDEPHRPHARHGRDHAPDLPAGGTGRLRG